MDEMEQDGRERICRVAERLFSEQGYAGVSMRDIARQAGLSKAAVYHHFAGKEELFVHVMERGLRRAAQTLRRAAQAAGDTKGKLQCVARALLEMKKSRRGMMQSAARDAMSGVIGRERVRELMRVMHDDLLGAIAEILDEGVARGEIRPDINTRMIAGILMGMIRDMGIFLVMVEHREPSPNDADMIIDILLKGIGEREHENNRS